MSEALLKLSVAVGPLYGVPAGNDVKSGATIPDVIDDSEEENDELLAKWPFCDGVPVYHLHESLDLVRLANSYSRIAPDRAVRIAALARCGGGTGCSKS